MKTYRLAFLLGILSTSLVGCNNGGSHTITFTGTNCSMSYKMGDEPITAPITVNHGGEANFVIYNEDSATYAVPNKLDIQGQAEVTYSPAGEISSQASLILKNITSNITITATARERAKICSVTYYSDENCQWDKDSNPGSILKNETLVAHLNVAQGYTFTNENIFIIIEGTQERLATDKYTFTNNNVLTLSGEYITNNLTIYAGYVSPDIKQYDVNFTMEHVAQETFPDKEWQYVPLEGTFVAEEGYRVPTEEEIVKKGYITKKKGGVIHPLTADQFYYEVYTDEATGHSAAYLYIYDIFELSDAESIDIEGAAIQQVSVTFKVGDGHWPEGAEATQPKIGTVDINSTLDDAAMACGASTTPVVDDEAMRFDAWYDGGGNPVPSTKVLEEDLEVEAGYAYKEYTINIDAVKKIKITGLPTDPVKYHAEVTGVTFTPDQYYKLPDSIIVRMSSTEGYQPLTPGTDYTYEPNAGKTQATFAIKPNVIEGNISIEASADKYVTVTFNSGEGTWPVAKSKDPYIVEVPAGSTYGDAFNITKDKTPECDGKTFAGWLKDGTETYVTMQDKIEEGVLSVSITATFTDMVNFSTDSWANVIEHAKNGYAQLKEYYGDSLFINATRLLKYTDPTTKVETLYTVRVIDYGYDHYYDSEGKATASALTFEFVELVGEGEYGSASASEGSNNWQQSTYRSWLDNFYTQIKTQNPGFEAKKAIKYTLQGRGAKPADKITTQDYFFPMSGAEINIAAVNSEVNETTYQDGQRENEGLLQGTLPYARYLNGTTSRLKKLDGTNTAYWLRSPHVNFEEWQSHAADYDQNECYYIKNTGGAPTDYAGTQTSAYSYWEHGYMAAFCI